MYILYEDAKRDAKTLRLAVVGMPGNTDTPWTRYKIAQQRSGRVLDEHLDTHLEEHRVLHARDGLVALDGGGEDLRRRRGRAMSGSATAK